MLLIASIVALAGCGWWETADKELRPQDRDALDLLYAEPLFDGVPPGAGALLGEDFQTSCGEEGSAPVGGKTWILRDSGQRALSHLKQLGLANGWEVVEESSPDPEAEYGTRQASLVMERQSGEYTFEFAVLIGMSNLHDEPEIGLHAQIDSPSIC